MDRRVDTCVDILDQVAWGVSSCSLRGLDRCRYILRSHHSPTIDKNQRAPSHAATAAVFPLWKNSLGRVCVRDWGLKTSIAIDLGSIPFIDFVFGVDPWWRWCHRSCFRRFLKQLQESRVWPVCEAWNLVFRSGYHFSCRYRGHVVRPFLGATVAPNSSKRIRRLHIGAGK